MVEPHEVLGVAPDASPEEVKRAYLALVQILHPDRLGTGSDAVLSQANRLMREVSEAYDQLKRDGLVYWDTPGWTHGQRASVTVKLLQARVPHHWDEDGSLSVGRKHEAAVDAIMALPR